VANGIASSYAERALMKRMLCAPIIFLFVDQSSSKFLPNVEGDVVDRVLFGF